MTVHYYQRRRRLRVAAAAASVLTLAGLLTALTLTGLTGQPDPPEAAPAAGRSDPTHATAAAAGQIDYLNGLYRAASKAGYPIHDLGDDANLALGLAICEDLAAGWPRGDITHALGQVREPIASMAAQLVTLATTHLCTHG